MAYIGNKPVIGQWRKLDDISGSFNGSLTNFTTQVGGVNVTAGSANQLLVSLGGVLQEPGTDYSVSSSTITFTTAPAASLSFFAVLAGDALNTSVPADGSITTAKLGANLTVDLDLGSAASPSLTFDADSGLFSGGDNQVAVSTSGVERVEFGASEVVFNDGGANYDFRVEGDTDANLLFVDASTDRVGIGTSSPSSRLTVVDSSSSTTGASGAFIDINNTDGNSSVVSGLRFKNGGTDSYKGAIYFKDTAGDARGDLIFATNDVASGGTEVGLSDARMTITRTGNVGIGTTSPSGLLHIEGNTCQMHFTDTDDASSSRIYQSGSTFAIDVDQANAKGSSVFAIRVDDSEAVRIDSSGRLLVGTNSATNNLRFDQKLAVVSTGSSNLGGAAFISYAGTSTDVGSFIDLSRSRGTTDGSFTSVANGDTLGWLIFRGTDGSQFLNAAFIKGVVDGTPGANDMPGRIEFYTSGDGTATPTERMRITNNGRFHFSSNIADSVRYGNLINNSISSSTADQWAFVVENNSDTSPFGMLIDYDDASPDGASNEFLRCTDSTATRVEIRSDGDIWTSDSGVLTSDATLKRDITDATPKLDDLMRLRVRNFYWTPEYHPNKQDKKLIGFIAQEVEEVFPGLVSNDNCISGGDPIYDEEGNDTGEKTPEVLKKGLKEAKLVPILVKALQEATERIETLEAKVAALEAN